MEIPSACEYPASQDQYTIVLPEAYHKIFAPTWWHENTFFKGLVNKSMG